MITCIVTSLSRDNILATPIEDVPLERLVGSKARYVDKNNKIWPAQVVGIEEQFLIMRFTGEFPSGLGQGQMMDVIEEGEDINQLE